MRHLSGMVNIQMYEFQGRKLDKVLHEVGDFIENNPNNSWDLKQECHEEYDGDNLFVVYLYATPCEVLVK